MYKFLDCTLEKATDKDERLLELHENKGQYPPRFRLLFQQNRTQQTTGQVCVAAITLKGMSSGEFQIAAVLGKVPSMFNYENNRYY